MRCVGVRLQAAEGERGGKLERGEDVDAAELLEQADDVRDEGHADAAAEAADERQELGEEGAEEIVSQFER